MSGDSTAGTAQISAADAAGDSAVFRVDGVLNFATVPELHAGSTPMFAGARTVIVDLSGVTAANSAGLALLLEWQRQARRTGRALFIRNLPRALASLAAMSELESCLPAAADA